MAKRPVHVVMTGAPCSGKTSAVRGLPDLLARRGLRTIVVPETASHLLASGAFGRKSPDDFLILQTAILRMQLLTEDLVTAAAEDADVVLYDRGALDGAAFVDDRLWRRILRRCGARQANLLARYDLVLLMELPGQSLYTTHTNCMRIEAYAQAQVQQEQLARRWSGHRALNRIPSMRTMKQRLGHLAKLIADHLA